MGGGLCFKVGPWTRLPCFYFWFHLLGFSLFLLPFSRRHYITALSNVHNMVVIVPIGLKIKTMFFVVSIFIFLSCTMVVHVITHTASLCVFQRPFLEMRKDKMNIISINLVIQFL